MFFYFLLWKRENNLKMALLQSDFEAIVNSMEKFVNLPYQDKVPVFPKKETKGTSHRSKTVLQHSLWTMCHLARWIDKNEDWISKRSLDAPTLLTAAFFHDIAKASGCEVTCFGRKDDITCFHDVYSALKYEGKGDWVHPEFSGDILLGRRPFLSCLLDINNTKKILDRQREKFDSKDDFYKITLTPAFFQQFDANQIVVALAAYMHWDVGNVNSAWKTPVVLSDLKEASVKYINKFKTECKKIGISPSPCLLDICILVSFADIRASAEADPKVSLDEITQWMKKYKIFGQLGRMKKLSTVTFNFPFFKNGKKAWSEYGMIEHALPIREMLLLSLDGDGITDNEIANLTNPDILGKIPYTF